MITNTCNPFALAIQYARDYVASQSQSSARSVFDSIN
jgi:hypothetical protein